MNARQAIGMAISGAQTIVDAYLEDLSDAELLVRPVPGANHIAWQVGHLISSENWMVNLTCPGLMPPLPAGFAERHTNDTAAVDDPKAFLSKAEYVRIWKEQRAGTQKALESLSDGDLDKPAPEPVRSYLNTVCDVFTCQGNHALMHAGQWAVVRRKLGRKPLF